MSENYFGGKHTDKKLETVADYLNFYTTALKNSNFNLKYFDAFAGTGHMKNLIDLPLLMDGKELEVMEGSTKRSLEINVPFANYHFVEKSKGKVEKLEKMILNYPDLVPRIKIDKGDAIEELRAFCADLKEFDRAVVFLDPCGGQVTYDVLKIIAQTKKVDLWYLFPSGLNVVRQMKMDNTVLPDALNNINSLFGTKDWIHEFVRYQEKPDLFGMQTITEREINADAVTRYMIKRMNLIFKGGVLDSWLPLGKGNAQWYSLLFACANPKHSANALAKKVAKEIMRKK